MKLYRAKVPAIAEECVRRLVEDGDIELADGMKEEAQKDFEAIMDDFLRRDSALREEIRDHMSTAGIPYDRYGKIRSQLAEERDHPLGDDVERFLVRQFVENLMITPAIEEVYADDRAIYKKLMEVVKSHDVDEEEIREEARGKIKNVSEGTVDYEIAMRNAVRDVKKRRGLL
ncbi:MAG: DUF507 family protein [Alphaproteobacteria bacterium]|nr:DUF507 family protein [Alphaproteobacteria bacterium]